MGREPAALLLLLALLVPHGSTAADASANTISCYTSVPRAPGQRPAATPVAFPRRDGYSACLRYQYRCTVDTSTCLASEIGAWKYHYYGSSVQQCRSILSNTPRMGLRSVLCCTADKCNAPDPRRDPATQLLPESWLSRSRPMSPRMSPLSSAAPASGQSKAAAGQSQSQSNNNVSLTGGVAPVPAPAPATAPAMPFAAAEEESIDSTAQHSQQQQLACWYSIPSAPGQAQEAALLAAEPGTQFCARWQMRCSLPSTACSQSDVAARAWRWVYGSVDQPGCRAMMKTSSSAGSSSSSSSSKGMKDAMCCSGTGCNKPDSRLDAATRIRRDAAAESAAGPAVQQPAILQPGSGPSAAMQQPVLIAAVGSAARGPGSAWISRFSSSSSSSSSSRDGSVRGR